MPTRASVFGFIGRERRYLQRCKVRKGFNMVVRFVAYDDAVSEITSVHDSMAYMCYLIGGDVRLTLKHIQKMCKCRGVVCNGRKLLRL